jgi:hypothetical protein
MDLYINGQKRRLTLSEISLFELLLGEFEAKSDDSNKIFSIDNPVYSLKDLNLLINIMKGESADLTYRILVLADYLMLNKIHHNLLCEKINKQKKIFIELINNEHLFKKYIPNLNDVDMLNSYYEQKNELIKYYSHKQIFNLLNSYYITSPGKIVETDDPKDGLLFTADDDELFYFNNNYFVITSSNSTFRSTIYSEKLLIFYLEHHKNLEKIIDELDYLEFINYTMIPIKTFKDIMMPQFKIFNKKIVLNLLKILKKKYDKAKSINPQENKLEEYLRVFTDILSYINTNCSDFTEDVIDELIRSTSYEAVCSPRKIYYLMLSENKERENIKVYMFKKIAEQANGKEIFRNIFNYFIDKRDYRLHTYLVSLKDIYFSLYDEEYNYDLDHAPLLHMYDLNYIFKIVETQDLNDEIIYELLCNKISCLDMGIKSEELIKSLLDKYKNGSLYKKYNGNSQFEHSLNKVFLDGSKETQKFMLKEKLVSHTLLAELKSEDKIKIVSEFMTDEWIERKRKAEMLDE